MPKIELNEGDRLEWAIKKFRKKVEKAGILKDLRKNRYYVKPSTAKRRKAQAAARRNRRKR